jgi:hypothetical protein
VTLARKYEYLDSRRFAPLIAGKNGPGPTGVVVGVVELSIQRDAKVLARLPVPGGGRGLMGAVTPW